MTKDIRQVAVLPFRSRLVQEQGSDSDDLDTYEVALFRSAENLCENNGPDARCDTAGGFYYGTPDPYEPKFCPVHWHEMHYGPQKTYDLVLAQDVDG